MILFSHICDNSTNWIRGNYQDSMNSDRAEILEILIHCCQIINNDFLPLWWCHCNHCHWRYQIAKWNIGINKSTLIYFHGIWQCIMTSKGKFRAPKERILSLDMLWQYLANRPHHLQLRTSRQKWGIMCAY